jgi:hypothetical protein
MKVHRMPSKAACLAISLLLASGGVVSAHHSSAAYDVEHRQTMQGTVKQVNWTNPHITFVVESDAKDGAQPVTWTFEVSSPGVLSRSGWTKRSLQPGDHAEFFYAPLRDGKRGGLLQKVMLPDGRELSYSLMPDEQ